MEGPGNAPLEGMARLTWWRFEGGSGVYRNVISGREIPEGEWDVEGNGFVQLAEDEGTSYTSAFCSAKPEPKSTMPPQVRTMNLPVRPARPLTTPPTIELPAGTKQTSTAGSKTAPPPAQQPVTKQVTIEDRPYTATYHRPAGAWFVIYHSQVLPITRNARRDNVIESNGIEIVVADWR